MGCTSGAMKCILNIMNVLLAIFGISLIVFATLMFKTAPPVYVYYLYIIGGVNFLAAMLGCFGICQENVCMTSAYAALILLSLISQVLGHIYASDSEAIRKFAADNVKETWLQEIQVSGSMDKIQKTFHCCGKNGPNDYATIGRPQVPASCYKDSDVKPENLFDTGCIFASEQNYLAVFNYSSSSEWGNLIFTAIMLLFALYLIVRFRNKQRRYNY